ncbi:deaminase [Achromobacter piechaudii]|uniref:Alanine dehydrogenase n=1 Tax=Achromobacter piechaudii TaxID=72556 RepID=A0ABM8KV28_9BURK|nr:ornithine cyclodeaminase family protein [Achromobacter piechaudii]KNY10945.1 deaminase [Achromobacter piechaudii]CAB3684619.1 Alanine dehydrogenase [Achromobacter piechaudii]CAB3868240.1 Alanine dehydrogenase [Achromobacter piechaudii]CAB3948439.1 Alanine dehydrogenase [Achromobacter piechaudii]
MADALLYLTERDVVSALNIPRAIDALADMLVAQAREQARNLPKTLATWGEGSSMHALGSVQTGQGGYAGFKTWVHTKAGGGSVFSLFDAETGTLRAIIEARALGMLRTAAISGVATRALAPADATQAALIGTGPQAVTQLAALAAVRPLRQVRVFSPTPEKRRAFVNSVAAKYDFEIVESPDLAHALAGAQIVTLITRAVEPFIDAAMLADCRHLNAVGAILPAKAEFGQDVFGLADEVVVDDLENARKGSRELRERFGSDGAPWQGVSVLGQWLADGKTRPSEARLTIFKGMGMGLSDLAMARVVHEHARAHGLGVALPPQTRENLLLAQP